MIKITDKAMCCGCTACASICPKGSIQMVSDNEGFLYPIVDEKTCINCGLCERVCPFKNKLDLKKQKPLTFAAKCKDDAIRKKSSSGGIFSLFAKIVISKKGCVYGVAMNNECDSSEHIRAIDEEGLERLRGSKYLQSDLKQTFKSVKEDLIKGKQVLFSGTPCQISGLSHYLGRAYDNLFMVEIICHGTPSVLLWRKYKDYLEKKHKSVITAVNFREKRNGWHNFGLSKKTESKLVYNSQFEDPYLVMFLKDICLRPSCYECLCKKIGSYADVTIGDYWGAKEDVPDMDDDKGLSLVMVQTEKGKMLLDGIIDDCIIVEANYENAIKHNNSYYESVKKPDSRDSFYIDLESVPFSKMIKKYSNIGMGLRIRQAIKRTPFYALLKRQGVTKIPFEYGLLIELKKN